MIVDHRPRAAVLLHCHRLLHGYSTRLHHHGLLVAWSVGSDGLCRALWHRKIL
jgi:hypothetical protein